MYPLITNVQRQCKDQRSLSSWNAVNASWGLPPVIIADWSSLPPADAELSALDVFFYIFFSIILKICN